MECQQGKHASLNRSRCKLDAARVASRFGVVEIGKGAPRGCFVDPFGDLPDQHALGFSLGHGGGEELPIEFGEGAPRIEDDAVLVLNSEIEVTLHIVDGLGNEIQAEQLVQVDVIQETCKRS